MGNPEKSESIYWQKEIETLPRPDLERLQVKRLQETVRRAGRVPFYRDQFNTSAINPEMIHAVEEIREFPFTTKDDLRRHYPYGMLAVPLEECVRVHASSGTTGRAVAILFTQKDIETWADSIARCLYGVGVRRSDIFQNMAGYGLFTGGLGFHYGAERLGLLTIPVSTGNSRRQIHIMQRFGTTLVHFMPSYGLYLINVFREMGLDPRKETRLKFAVLGAENYSEETRHRLESFYGIDAFDSYGLSEMNGPGVSFECHLKDGLHVWEDHYLLEVVEPDGEAPVPDGEVGEIVFTTLSREAMPIIRFRTRDLAAVIPEPCKCGRTHRRLSRIQGRVDDMIIFKGVNIFPVQIEQVLMSIPEVSETYQIILESRDNKDWMTILVEIREDLMQGDPQRREGVRRKVIESLQSELLVRPEVRLVPIGTIEVTEVGKTKRVIDKRTI